MIGCILTTFFMRTILNHLSRVEITLDLSRDNTEVESSWEANVSHSFGTPPYFRFMHSDFLKCQRTIVYIRTGDVSCHGFCIVFFFCHKKGGQRSRRGHVTFVFSLWRDASVPCTNATFRNVTYVLWHAGVECDRLARNVSYSAWVRIRVHRHNGCWAGACGVTRITMISRRGCHT